MDTTVQIKFALRLSPETRGLQTELISKLSIYDELKHEEQYSLD